MIPIESTKGYLNKYTQTRTMQVVKTVKKKSSKEYQREWREKNPHYFEKYYKNNPTSYAKSHAKYMKTKKGQVAEVKFETSVKRKEYKKLWMQQYRRDIKEGKKRKGKKRGAKKKNG